MPARAITPDKRLDSWRGTVTITVQEVVMKLHPVSLARGQVLDLRRVGIRRFVWKLRRPVHQTYKAVTALAVAPELRFERNHRLPFISERLVEYSTALRWIAQRYPRTLLDVGPGEGVWPALLHAEGIDVVALDDVRGYWGTNFANRHFRVTRGDICEPGAVAGAFDCVTCISTLEHIPPHRDAMKKMLDALVPGGELIVTVPYNEHRYYANVYALATAGYGQDARYVAQQFSRTEVDEWIRRPDVELVELERWCVFTGEHWTEGERIPIPRIAGPDDRHQLACLRFRRLEPDGA
jgi:SAM-dependent methyltransferase